MLLRPIWPDGVHARVASTANTFTLTAYNQDGSVDSSLNGIYPITVNGAQSSPDGTAPTLPTTATFSSGDAHIIAESSTGKHQGV
jgi:hypothetical protein